MSNSSHKSDQLDLPFDVEATSAVVIPFVPRSSRPSAEAAAPAQRSSLTASDPSDAEILRRVVARAERLGW